MLLKKATKLLETMCYNFFEQTFNLKILGGYTGAAKTEILHSLKIKGQQVIDLEGLANHRGSAFGGIDLPPQPTTEQFENNLFSKLRSLNPNTAIWVEDESKSIGKVSIPNAFYLAMGTMPVYFLDVPFQERTKHLVDTYANLNQDKLAESIGRIAKRLGNDRAKLALEALASKNYHKVVEITLFYYDKYYLKGLQKREETTIQKIKVPQINPKKTADFLISLLHDENG